METINFSQKITRENSIHFGTRQYVIALNSEIDKYKFVVTNGVDRCCVLRMKGDKYTLFAHLDPLAYKNLDGFKKFIEDFRKVEKKTEIECDYFLGSKSDMNEQFLANLGESLKNSGYGKVAKEMRVDMEIKESNEDINLVDLVYDLNKKMVCVVKFDYDFNKIGQKNNTQNSNIVESLISKSRSKSPHRMEQDLMNNETILMHLIKDDCFRNKISMKGSDQKSISIDEILPSGYIKNQKRFLQENDVISFCDRIGTECVYYLPKFDEEEENEEELKQILQGIKLMHKNPENTMFGYYLEEGSRNLKPLEDTGDLTKKKFVLTDPNVIFAPKFQSQKKKFILTNPDDIFSKDKTELESNTKSLKPSSITADSGEKKDNAPSSQAKPIHKSLLDSKKNKGSNNIT